MGCPRNRVNSSPQPHHFLLSVSHWRSGKPTTTLAFYAHWIPGGDKTHIDRLAAARLAVAPKVPPTVPDDMRTPKAWHQSGAISKNVEVSDSQLPEGVGSPGWARTSDFLINRRGPVNSRPFFFPRTCA